ncbi:MAG TPA: response regulator [Granulicella sp.]
MIVSGNRPTILLVCPAPVMRAVLREVLDGAQYNVEAVSGLGGAVDRLKRIKPDLLVVRSYLNSIEGHDAAVYLRTKCPGMKVLILSGMLDDDRLLRRERLESFEIFPKPYTAQELLQKVEQALGAAVES